MWRENGPHIWLKECIPLINGLEREILQVEEQIILGKGHVEVSMGIGTTNNNFCTIH